MKDYLADFAELIIFQSLSIDEPKCQRFTDVKSRIAHNGDILNGYNNDMSFHCITFHIMANASSESDNLGTRHRASTEQSLTFCVRTMFCNIARWRQACWLVDWLVGWFEFNVTVLRLYIRDEGKLVTTVRVMLT